MPPPSEVTQIHTARARKLFTDLAGAPFIAMCFVDGSLRVYTKGLDSRANSLVRRLMDLLEEEVDGEE